MQWDFSPRDPKARMKIVTKIERVQPYVAGIDERGEFIWEGRTMPRWQMEMFRLFVDWAGSRYRQWIEMFYYQDSERAFRPDGSDVPDQDKAMTKAHINDRRRMYPERKQFRKRDGD